MNGSEAVAQFLKDKGVRHAFGIVGAGNAAIFDAVHRLGYTQIVCVHHEQAATMAAQAYWRVSGVLGVSIVTTGGGSANAVTGVVSAWMDSIPTLTISGNEARSHCESLWRGWGVQGFDSVAMVKKVTKNARRVYVARAISRSLEEATNEALTGRFGPVWVDIPRDIQTDEILL
jgi:acetolactate synthase I/II/III large subunit